VVLLGSPCFRIHLNYRIIELYRVALRSISLFCLSLIYLLRIRLLRRVQGTDESGSKVKERERIRELRAEVLRRTMQLLLTILATPPSNPSHSAHASVTPSGVREMLLREGLLGKEFFHLVSTAVTLAAVTSLHKKSIGTKSYAPICHHFTLTLPHTSSRSSTPCWVCPLQVLCPLRHRTK
jgi:hypothetical protein